MERQIIEEGKRGRVEMRVIVDSTETDRLNALERNELGKGFTKSRAMRKIANIDLAEYNALLMKMDKDALDFEASGQRDRRILAKLLRRFPLWRCSEGRV